jgi:hypothetical protein
MDPLMVSLETLLAASPLLGHRLEDRRPIREAHDADIAQACQLRSTCSLGHPAQAALFAVAPLDILVTENTDGEKQFHVIELNGTGLGGLTNLPEPILAAVLENFTEMGRHSATGTPLILVASSGKERDQSPRMNRLLHEKMLYAEALKRGLESQGETVLISSLPLVQQEPRLLAKKQPAVVLGYMKDLLEHLRLDWQGRLTFLGRPVTAAVNDRFCLNICDRFAQQVDLRHFQTMNRCFLAGADKGVAYHVLNEFLAELDSPHFPRRVEFTHASSRHRLIATVAEWLREGRSAVIKPRGTGCGHGIEFFTAPQDDIGQIIARVDASIRETEEYYRLAGGAFPYTICEFLDACAIQQPGSPFTGHKYELRVVVYREELTLKAFPAIAKISSRPYDARQPDRLSLLNNITMAVESTQVAGTEFMKPLCHPETLDLLGLRVEHLTELSAICTGFVRHLLNKVHDRPEWFGLPRAWRPPPPRLARSSLLQCA